MFGHFGDRLGRKRTLVATMMVMGIATVGVGLIPSAATIGIAAPLLLITLRLMQGFAVGGEWAGSVLMSAENAPAQRRGFYGMFTQLGLGTAAPTGRAMNAAAKVPREVVVAITWLSSGKNTVGKTSAAAVP